MSGAVAGVEGVHQAVLLPGEKFLCTSLKFGTLDMLSTSSLFAGNNVRIYYTDGASLIIKSTEVDAVDYFRPSPGGGGAWVRET